MSALKKISYQHTSCTSAQADYEAVVAIYWDKLLGIASAKTNPHDAFDIVQDVLMSLWVKWEEVPKDETLEFYLLHALKLRVFNYYRTNGRYQAHLKRLEVVLNDTLESSDALVPDVLHELKDAIVSEALDILSPSQRQLFILRVNYHYSYRKIAEQLGIDAASARVLYSRALKQVKAHIKSNPALSASLISSLMVFTIS
ncbi:RNA polymerase sigma factor [Chitinophaga arvensicola]|uniref:RNA polymerase sigma factor, sigma-70 family n=1 Tax=Chitinophaga arvensicola TaxID=29529 RepID=A0A1I0QX68_9BACT|nr:sigma-70 family RNA polymerase sigma factor [Chitinophaga arvensicola]SEW32273.1 RNA polymerase sigma factor, sigma-70 family [Chitinophaga arvensicola]